MMMFSTMFYSLMFFWFFFFVFVYTAHSSHYIYCFSLFTSNNSKYEDWTTHTCPRYVYS